MRSGFVAANAGALIFVGLAMTAAGQQPAGQQPATQQAAQQVPAQQPPAPGLVVEDVPVLHADPTGTVAASVVLRNAGTGPIAIRLNISDFDFHAPNGATWPLGATISWSAASVADKSILNGLKPLDAGHELTAKMTVVHLWEAGESTGVLRNADSDIPTTSGQKQCILQAVRVPDAFNVSLDVPGNPPELDFDALGTGEQHYLVRLVNADPMTYRFHWALRLDDQLQSPSKDIVDLPPGGSAYIDLATVAPRPAGVAGWISQFLAQGTIKDEMTSGGLVLTPVFASANIPPAPLKVLPVSVRLRFWSDGLQEFFNLVCVFLLLTAGGVASIWVHCGMPNTARALQLQKRLRAVEAQINGLGGDIRSEWRVLLAGGCRTLAADLESTWWVFPAFADVVSQATTNIGMLEAWGAVAYDVSIVLRRTRSQAQDGIPPTVLHWIETSCEDALAPIESGRTNEEELQNMRASVKYALDLLHLLEDGKQIPDLEQEIGEREKRLAERTIDQNWPAEFAFLANQVSESMKTPLSPPLYTDRDTLSLKLDLLNEFLGYYERSQSGAYTAAAATASASGPPISITAPRASDVLTALENYRTRFFRYLGPDAPESLRMARLFVAEMRQNVYAPELVEEARKQPSGLQVLVEPAQIRAATCVHFQLLFRRQALNESSARHEWTCIWNFGDGCAAETGWEVHHGFERDGCYDATVEVTDLNGDSVAPPLVKQLRVGEWLSADAGWRDRMGMAARRMARMWKPHAETILEASRLALVLAVAVFGLITTARQQAASLTLPEAIGAVIALGFGADTLKNLITDKTASS